MWIGDVHTQLVAGPKRLMDDVIDIHEPIEMMEDITQIETNTRVEIIQIEITECLFLIFASIALFKSILNALVQNGVLVLNILISLNVDLIEACIGT